MTSGEKRNLYTRYPSSRVLIYNGTTVAHYVLGGMGIILGDGSWIGYLLGSLYLLFTNFLPKPMDCACGEFNGQIFCGRQGAVYASDRSGEVN
ncbi:MAG: hypothetical protein ABIH70_10255 [Chloroflexota bacterium]